LTVHEFAEQIRVDDLFGVRELAKLDEFMRRANLSDEAVSFGLVPA
jgi:hypothetical protein